MQIDNIFLALITLGALYYLYKRLFNTKGCDGCGESCRTSKQPKHRDKEPNP